MPCSSVPRSFFALTTKKSYVVAPGEACAMAKGSAWADAPRAHATAATSVENRFMVSPDVGLDEAVGDSHRNGCANPAITVQSTSWRIARPRSQAAAGEMPQ